MRLLTFGLGLFGVVSASLYLYICYFSEHDDNKALSKKNKKRTKKVVGSEKENKSSKISTKRSDESESSEQTVSNLQDNKANDLINVLSSNQEFSFLSNSETSQVLTALANCSGFTTSQNIIRELGGLQTISQCLFSEDPTIKLKAIWALSNLAINEENQRQLVELLPVIEETFEIVQQQQQQQQQHLQQGQHFINQYVKEYLLMALRFLLNLSMNEDLHDAIMATSIPKSVICFLAKPYCEMIRFKALQVTANLTCKEETGLTLCKMKVLPPLYAFVVENDFDILRRVLLILKKLLGYMKNDDSLSGILKERAYIAHKQWMKIRCKDIIDNFKLQGTNAEEDEQEIKKLAQSVLNNILLLE